jgi:hypothetical protein
MVSKQSPTANNHVAKPIKHSHVKESAAPPHKAASVDNSGWMEKIKSLQAVRTVSANELTSLSALIAYAAFKTGTSEFRIERDLADRFNIANVKCLPSARFDDAMRYLVDQVPTQSA